MVVQDIPGFTVAIHETQDVTDELFRAVASVFAENYRDANLGYLEKNLGKLRVLATAVTDEGTMAAFALGEARVVDLPRLPATNVRLGGLCCVSTPFRSKGLFSRLEGMALTARQLPPAERWLSSGRCAHPASFRGFAKNPQAVPYRGKKPTEWQKEVGQAIADVYGSPGFDPETFVVKGSGVPIGWPVIEIHAEPEEWDLFGPVDRSKGDSLLGIAWHGSVPEGWET